MKRLDALAKWILKTLQADGKTTASWMAARMSMRKSSICDRLARLKGDGVIKGFTVILDEKKLGWAETTLAIIALESNRSTELKDFEDTMQDMPEVLECYMIKGSADFFVKFLSKDVEDEERLIRRIADMDNVRSIRAYEAIKCSFTRGPDPGNE